MPLLDYGLADFVAKQKAKASEANAKFNALKTLLNVTKLDAANIQELGIVTALLANGAVTPEKLSPALRAALGLNAAGEEVYRGKAIIATEEARSNTAYGVLPTPDRVQNVELPNGGLIRVGYHALVKSSNESQGSAGLFLGDELVKFHMLNSAGGNVLADAEAYAWGTSYTTLQSWAGGLFSHYHATPNLPEAPTTGMAFGLMIDETSANNDNFIGGPQGGTALAARIGRGRIAGIAGSFGGGALGGEAIIFADPGIYDITVQYKAGVGSVTAKTRKLWVEARAY